MTKYYNLLNDSFSEILDKALTDKFGEHKFKTSWNIISMTLITTWDEKAPKKAKAEWKHYTEAFSEGYGKAMDKIGAEEMKK